MSVYRPHGRKRRKLSEAEGSHRRVRARREERPWWGLHREVLSPWLRARSIVDIILGYVLVPGLEGKLLKTEIPSFLSDPDDMRARNLPIWMCKGHPSISDLTALPRGLFYILSSQSTEERVHAFEGFGRGAKHSEPWKGSKDRSFGCLHSRAIVAVSSIASKVHFASAAREGKGKGKVNKNSFEIGTCHIDERTHRLGKYQKHFQTKLGVDALAVSQDGQRMFLVRCRERSVCITRNHDILQGVGDEFDLVELMGDTSSTRSEGISIVAVRRAICISANESVLILLECKSAARTDNFCVLLLYRDKLCRVVRISRGTARKFQPCVTDLCVCEESGEMYVLSTSDNGCIIRVYNLLQPGGHCKKKIYINEDTSNCLRVPPELPQFSVRQFVMFRGIPSNSHATITITRMKTGGPLVVMGANLARLYYL